LTEQQEMRTLIGQYRTLRNREEKILYALDLTAVLYVVERPILEIELEIEDLPEPQRDEIVAEVVEGKRPFPPILNYSQEDIAEFSLGHRLERELRQFSDFRLKRFIVDTIKEMYEKKFSALQDSDVEYWMKLPFRKPEEAAALSLGYEPGELTLDLVQKEFAGSSLGISFSRRLLSILRAVEAGELKESTKPSAFINWASSSGILLPPKMVAAGVQPDIETGEKLNPRARHALLEIIHVLAFGHPSVEEPEEHKARDKIMDVCAVYPLSLHRDTVKKYVAEACSHVASVVMRR
jgi:hypothetical protein